MNEVIVIRGEPREEILFALRERGYELATVQGDQAILVRPPRECTTGCSADRLVAQLERTWAAGDRELSLHRFVLHSVEKPLIENALVRTGNNQLKAAEWLGINRNTLRTKIRKLAITLPCTRHP